MTTESRMEEQDVQRVLPNETTLNQTTLAYVSMLLDGTPIPEQPFMQSMVYIEGKGWLRVSYTINHEWVNAPSREALDALASGEVPVQEFLVQTRGEGGGA